MEQQLKSPVAERLYLDFVGVASHYFLQGRKFDAQEIQRQMRPGFNSIIPDPPYGTVDRIRNELLSLDKVSGIYSRVERFFRNEATIGETLANLGTKFSCLEADLSQAVSQNEQLESKYKSLNSALKDYLYKESSDNIPLQDDIALVGIVQQSIGAFGAMLESKLIKISEFNRYLASVAGMHKENR